MINPTSLPGNVVAGGPILWRKHALLQWVNRTMSMASPAGQLGTETTRPVHKSSRPLGPSTAMRRDIKDEPGDRLCTSGTTRREHADRVTIIYNNNAI